MRQIYKDNWQSYLKLGLIPLPAFRTDKYPIDEIKWGQYQEGPPCSDEYLEWEDRYADYNIWVLLKEFVVIDPDGAGAEEFVQSLNLPKCPTSISGRKSIHRWFKTSSPLKSLKIQNEDKTYLELRTGNLGMLVPPSIHPETKKPYQWDKGHSPWDIPFPEFPLEVYEIIQNLLPKPEPQMVAIQTENSSQGYLDVERYLKHYLIQYRTKRDGNRTIYTLDHCLFAEFHTTKNIPGDSSIIQGADGKLGYQCFHNHCQSKTWKDARQIISGEDSLSQFIKKPNPCLNALLDADSLIQRNDIPPKKKIVDPWLSERSINLISGWRGIGKTWFGFSLCDAISRGKQFGPWRIENPVNCLYIDAEMYEGDTQERLRLLNKEKDLRKTSLIIYSDSYANSIGIKRANLLRSQWREDIKSLSIDKGINLIGIDNVSSLAPGIEENKKEPWDPINQWLIDLRFNNISTLLFHHTNKTGDQRGTSGREDNIDVAIILQRPHDYRTEDGARFIVKFKKTRISVKDWGLIQDFEFHLTEINGHVEWAWSSAKKKNQIEIIRMIDEGITQNDIAKSLNIDKGYVSRVKSHAIRDGYLSEKGKLTQSGFLLVNSVENEDEI